MGEQDRIAWVVYTNTDLTGGRGWQFPLHVCDKEATAKRLAKKAGVQGCDAEVVQVKLMKFGGFGGTWFGPVHIKQATREDEMAQKQLEAQKEVLARARAAGLSDDDLRALRAISPCPAPPTPETAMSEIVGAAVAGFRQAFAGARTVIGLPARLFRWLTGASQ